MLGEDALGNEEGGRRDGKVGRWRRCRGLRNRVQIISTSARATSCSNEQPPGHGGCRAVVCLHNDNHIIDIAWSSSSLAHHSTIDKLFAVASCALVFTNFLLLFGMVYRATVLTQTTISNIFISSQLRGITAANAYFI